MKNKKTSFIIVLVFAVLIVGLGMFMISQEFPGWRKINTIEGYKDIFNSPISEITLRKSVTLAEYVEFDDEELIEKWEIFLKGLEVQRGRSVTQADKNKDGGGPTIVIKTDTDEFVFSIGRISGGDVIETDDYFYYFKSDVELPFDETYDIAAERYGIKTPWD